MSTIDTSTWSPDSSLNTDIGGIPLNPNASIAQTWQALRILMAAVKGDGDAIKAMIDVMQGATASADGVSGLVPKPEAGDQDKVLTGAGTWEAVAAASHAHGNISSDGKLGTASRAVVTDGNKLIDVSSVTATELGCLSGATSSIQTQLDAKAADAVVVHVTGAEAIAGAKTFNGDIIASGKVCKEDNADSLKLCGGKAFSYTNGAKITLFGASSVDSPGSFQMAAGGSAQKILNGKPDGTLTWDGSAIQISSDGRLKTPLSTVPDAVLDAWGEVKWGQFWYLDAVECKGEKARLHLGLIAQHVQRVFADRELDACEYGILCYEENLWMVRYTEAFAMEAAFQRRRADRLEARIAALEVANA